MIKRDFFTKKNNDSFILFYYRPIKEFIWWLIFLLKFLSFRISSNLHIRIRNYFLIKNNSFARNRTKYVKNFYAKTKKDFYEIQIKNTTRTCNIFEEKETLSFFSEGEKNHFLFGISPLVEIYNIKNIKKWTLTIEIKTNSDVLEQIVLDFPIGEYNRSNRMVYKASDGWIDLRIDISKYLGKKISIELNVETKKIKTTKFKEKFSLSSPTFVDKKEDFKNIIILSMESLSDIKFLSEKYSLPKLPNLEKLMNLSQVYKEAFSPIDATLTYAASLMSGLLPSQHGIGDYSKNADGFENNTLSKQLISLPENFKSKEFMTFCSATASRFNSKIGFSKAFDDYFQVNKNFDINKPKMDWLLNGLNSFKGFDKFFLMHLDFLHEPYFSFSDGKKPFSFSSKELSKNDQDFNVYGYKRGLEELDQELGLLMNYLDDKSELNRTLIVLTGDHGNGINWEKNSDFSLYDERLRVPLLIKYPSYINIKNKNLNNPVNSVFEIHEILNSYLGINLPKEIKILPQYSETYKDYVFSEVIMMPRKDKKRHSLSVIYKDYKYVCSNIIDWKNFKVEKKVDESLFKRDSKSSNFNEEEDLTLFEENDYLDHLRKVAYSAIDLNLNFQRKYPPNKY